MQRFLWFLFVAFFTVSVSGCQAAASLLPTQTPYATYTPNPTYTPVATYTPYPTLTATPAPTAAAVLFDANDFAAVDSCFPVNSAPDVRRFAENGQYHIVVQQAVYFGWSICEKDFRNFVLEVDATPITGPKNNAFAYGVLFRGDDRTDAFYVFLISGDGYYSLSASYPDNFYSLLAWSSIREIHQGKSTNHLKVVVWGDQIELYVNDALIGLMREGTLKTGYFGFIVETFDEADVQVAFDNLVITER